MEKSLSPHDALFKRTFGQPEHAAAELRATLPEPIAREVDWSTLKREAGSFIDDELSERRSDLLYSARFAGRTALLYVVFEHQSSSDRWMALRLLRYMVRVWTRWRDQHPGARRLPPVLPVVLYHGQGRWRAERRFEALLDLPAECAEAALPHLPRFELLVDDLTQSTDEALEGRQLTALGLLTLLLFRHGRHPQLHERLPQWAERFAEVYDGPPGPRAVLSLMCYILQVSPDLTPERLAAVVGSTAGEEIGEAAMTAGQRLIEEGFEKGLEQGLEQGLEKGLEQGLERGRTQEGRRLLLKLLKLKFGSLPPEAVERVQGADLARVERWSERILTADSLAAVFAE